MLWEQPGSLGLACFFFSDSHFSLSFRKSKYAAEWFSLINIKIPRMCLSLIKVANCQETNSLTLNFSVPIPSCREAQMRDSDTFLPVPFAKWNHGIMSYSLFPAHFVCKVFPHSPSLFFQYLLEPNSFLHSCPAWPSLESWPFHAQSLLNLSSSWSRQRVSLAASSFLPCAWQTVSREGKRFFAFSYSALCHSGI